VVLEGLSAKVAFREMNPVVLRGLGFVLVICAAIQAGLEKPFKAIVVQVFRQSVLLLSITIPST
jgi:hypothetical protein